MEQEWVSASRTRNFTLRDPLLDWLDLFGQECGSVRDDCLPGYDERTDFTAFLFAKGKAFEAAVVAYLSGLVGDVQAIASCPADVADPSKAAETIRAMQSGVPLITQAVLHHQASKTYGAADLLFRSDVLRELFPDALTEEEACGCAPLIDGPWHYRVVDIKYSTLHLTAKRHAARDHATYMTQVFTYNRALGEAQGYQPDCGYLLGRGWVQGDERGSSAMDCLAPVEMDYASRGFVLAEAVNDAVAWIRRLRRDGSGWDPLLAKDVPELRPNMKNAQDAPWHEAKALIARETGELTSLWQVGVELRDRAPDSGISGSTDPRCSAASLGLTGPIRSSTLDAILEVNRDGATTAVSPTRVRAGRDVWGEVPPLEFFVDFETVNSLDDDFTRIPQQNGRPLITMIGCGHGEGGEWRFSQFSVSELSEDAERNAIEAWLGHMEATQRRLWPGGRPLIYHWSHAEASTLDNAYNAARRRHPGRNWPDISWYDLLTNVVRAEPFVARGAFGFGLKAVARAMHSHGLIDTTWHDSSVDGLGAMVGTWWTATEAERLGCDLNEIELMNEIATYNEVDCRVMMEILRHLRILA